MSHLTNTALLAAIDTIDKICRRSALPTAQQLLLRSYCFLALNEPALVLRDLDKALYVDGTDPDVQFAKLSLTEDGVIARLLFANAFASDRQRARAVMSLLSKTKIALTAQRSRSDIFGVVAWLGSGAPALTFGGRSVDLGSQVLLNSGGVKACAFQFVDDGDAAVQIEARYASDACSIQIGRRPVACPEPAAGPATAVSVVVPVFAGPEATRACLGALTVKQVDDALEVVVVDDGCPAPKLSEEVETTCRRNGWRHVRNAQNLGFACSVNIGVSLAQGRHLLLLNADAVLPPGAISRLSRAASHREVGTVVPFSNDGGFTSFPQPRDNNAVPSDREARRIDDAAQQAGDRPVDIPSGTGFCMLVTRDCWTAVGGLNVDYGRGYYEDIDFCRRAKALGFRNVVAPNLFVRHIGRQSFGDAKRVLVAQNAHLLRERFPDYDAEWMAFIDADSLRPQRGWIERRVPPREPVRLLVGRAAVLGAVLAVRAGAVTRQGQRALILSWSTDGSIRIQACDGNNPQSLRFEASDRSGLRAYLKNLDLRSIDLVEPDAVSSALLEVLVGATTKLRIVVAGRRAARFMIEDCPAWARDLRVVTLDGMARSALGQPVDPHPIRSADMIAPRSSSLRVAALVPIARPSAARFAAVLDRMLKPVGGDVIILGESVGSSSCYVTGAMSPDEYLSAFRYRAVTHLLLPDPDTPFWFLEHLQDRDSLPAAYHDWSGHRYPSRCDDLAIDEKVAVDAASAAVRDWCISSAKQASEPIRR